ncbi:MAG TPA: hypothetical protein V6D02_02250 [Candidatus Obscuribacterales bacterium]
MTTLDTATQASLQNALYAYLHDFGGESLAEARAIAGAILAVKERSGALVPQGLALETWVDDLVQDFDLSQISTRLRDAEAIAIAIQAKNWRETVEMRAKATLDAYFQQYMPTGESAALTSIIATILPIIEDAQISRDEAQRLIHTLSQQFDGPAALAQVIDPTWLQLAEKTHQYLRHRQVESSVQEVVNAYVHKFQPTAVEMGESLIEQAVQAVTNNKVKLGLEVDLDPATRKLLVKQVMLKFNLMTASPPPSGTALEIAQQVQTEVLRYQAAQGNISYQPAVRRTDQADDSSALGGEMSIGYDLQPPTVPRPADGAPPPTGE